jgi:putative tryptophan/tyrosine transport system substrate-binding protein
MNRRAFISLIASAAATPSVAWLRAARAQQATMPVIGFLNSASPTEFAAQLTAFHQGLGAAGYVEGRNLAIEYRWAESQYTRLPDLAADLVRRQVAVLVATGGLVACLAAKAATSTIPIVFNLGGDPVRFGLVASLNRPGGNITGVSFLINQLVAKQLDLLNQLIPAAAVIAFLVNPDNPLAVTDTADLEAAAGRRGLKLRVLSARSQADLEATFAALAGERAAALMVSSDPIFVASHAQIAALAARDRIPAMFGYRQGPVAGGLMSYGANIADSYRQAGAYTARVLRGEKPADLPVMQPTKFELVINLKTAKALGLEVPDKFLALADEVIE